MAPHPHPTEEPHHWPDTTPLPHRRLPIVLATVGALVFGTALGWARLSATDGSLDSIIANNFGGGRQIVTISGSDVAFETDSCGGWTKI